MQGFPTSPRSEGVPQGDLHVDLRDVPPTSQASHLISHSHQYRSFNEGLHKPLNTPPFRDPVPNRLRHKTIRPGDLGYRPGLLDDLENDLFLEAYSWGLFGWVLVISDEACH